MIALNEYRESLKPRKSPKRVGRGIGSGLGKTSGRGAKGAKSRSGYKSRAGNEGGNVPTYQKFPKRGFSRKGLAEDIQVINLDRIDELFEVGETVNLPSLRSKGYLKKTSGQLKILGRGEITKKIFIECSALSLSARQKLDASSADYKIF